MSKKFIAKFVGVAMVLSLAVAGAAPAGAQTVAELQAQIDALLAQLAGLSGSSSSSTSCYAYTRDLTLGSTGADVVELQNALVASGHLVMPAGVSMGYFGALTQSSLAKWQAANGVSPASGYFGPVTRGAFAAKCTTTGGTGSTGSTSGSDLEGGAGSIEDADFVSSLNNEEVGEGEEDVEVAGLEIESDGSDIEITAIGLTFDEGTAGSDFDDYASEVSVWFNGEEVARVDADEFNDDNNWNSTVSLDEGVIIREGDTEEIIVAVSAQNNLDSSDQGDTWDVAFENVRFRDAQGAVVTDSTTGDIDSTVPAGTTSRTFSFESFATAADVEFHITAGDDAVNDARTITIDDNDDTNDVEILSMMWEAEGNSDLEVKEFGVNLDVVGESHVDDVVAGGTNPAIRLIIDGEEYGDATYFDDADDTDVGTDEDVLFEDVDYVLEAGEEVEVLIVVDLLSTGDGLAEGTTIAANVGETETDQTTLVDIEDEEGEQLGDSDLTGSATGEAHSLFENGIMVEAVSTDADVNEAEDTGTFRVTVNVTAFGEDQYIHELASNASSTDAGFYYTVFKNGSATSTNITLGDVVNTSADEDGEYFVVREGQTEQFEITVTVNPDAAGLYNVELGISGTGGVRFDPDNAADSASTEDTWYTIPDAEDVSTPAVQVDAS